MKVRNSTTLITISFGLLSLIYSIYSDVFTQGSNEITNLITIPFRSLFKIQKRPLYINDLIKKKDEKNKTKNGSENKQIKPSLTYLFVLDESGTVVSEKKPKPGWYKNLIDKLNLKIGDNNYEEKIKEISGFTLSSLKLSKILIDLLKVVENHSIEKQLDISFAILSLGNRTVNIFPNTEKREVYKLANNKSILEAMKEVDTWNVSIIKNDKNGNRIQNTDFIDLFDKIIDRYKLNESKKGGDYSIPSFILIVFGDLIHDIEDKLKDDVTEYTTLRELFELTKIDLLDKIDTISKSNILTNIIFLSDDSNSKQTDLDKNRFKIDIWPIFSKKIDSFRLKKTSISEDDDNLLYVPIRSERNIPFYYTNPFYINNSYVDIKISEYGINYKLALKTDNASSLSRLKNLKFSILNTDHRTKGNKNCSGVLDAGKSTNYMEIDKGETIRLEYNGRLPAVDAELIIFFPKEDNRAFVFSIDFIKDLPWFSAFFMVTFQVILIVSFIICAKEWIQQIKKRNNKKEVLQISYNELQKPTTYEQKIIQK